LWNGFEVHTLVVETNHDEKLLQSDTHRPWPVKQRIQSRHGHLSNNAAATVIEELLPGKIDRVVLGHLSRDCNTPALALQTVREALSKCGKIDIELFCATHGYQSQVSHRRDRARRTSRLSRTHFPGSMSGLRLNVAGQRQRKK
jgi:hypothetical protein